VNTGAALRLLFLQARIAGVSPSEPAAEGHKPIKGGVNLSSARAFATVLLAIWYVSVDVAVDHAVKMELLQSARQMFAAHFIADQSEQNSDESSEDLPHYLGTPTIERRRLPGLMGSGRTIRGVEVVQINGERWNAVAPYIQGSNDKQVAMTRVLVIASQGGIDVSGEEPFYELFGRVQQALLASQKKVSVPVVGVPVEASNATWALAGLTLILLLLIQSRVRRVFLDPELAIEQPWLVLDWRTPIERGAAVTWLLLMLLVPWVSNAALTVVLAAQISAEGAITSIPGDVIRISLMLCIFVLSAWTALLTVTDLNHLRTLRIRQLVVDDPLIGREDARDRDDDEGR
jgi:hypothetical protein